MHATDSVLAEIERRLHDAAESEVKSVRLAASHVITSGGRRVRPRLVALVGDLLGARPEVSAACGLAVELVHTATLLHDDIIDHSPLRRGRPAVHAQYGLGAAVLAGDFLLTQALHGLTELGLFAATHEMAVAVREMVEGELLQLENAYAHTTSLEASRRIARGKTGALFAWCARAHAVTLALPEDRVAALDAIGRTLGYAFQVEDDLLDFGGRDVGKPVEKDLREGQLSVPVQLARTEDAALNAALEKAFVTRAEADFAAAYAALGYSRAADLGRAELVACRSRVVELAGAFDSGDAGPRLGAYFDAFIAPERQVSSRRSQ